MPPGGPPAGHRMRPSGPRSTLPGHRVRHPIVHSVCARYYRSVTKVAGQHRMFSVRNLSIPRLMPGFSHDLRSIRCNSGTKFPDMSACTHITAPECRADYRKAAPAAKPYPGGEVRRIPAKLFGTQPVAAVTTAFAVGIIMPMMIGTGGQSNGQASGARSASHAGTANGPVWAVTVTGRKVLVPKPKFAAT